MRTNIKHPCSLILTTRAVALVIPAFINKQEKLGRWTPVLGATSKKLGRCSLVFTFIVGGYPSFFAITTKTRVYLPNIFGVIYHNFVAYFVNFRFVAS